MGQQTVEIKFQGEQVGSHTDKKNTTYTLYRYFVEVRREPDHVAGEPNLWLTFRRIYGDRASLFRAILACISHPNKLPRIGSMMYGWMAGTDALLHREA